MASVLVTYASRHGSTAEIARVIADKLRETSLSVDCVPADWVTSVAPYDAVVLGGAVYFNHWHSDAVRFLHRFSAPLSRRAVWTFSSGPVGEPEAGADRRPPRRIGRVLDQFGVRGHAVFGGCLPAEPRGRLQRRMVRRVPRPFRDRRDWGEIRTWAMGIAVELGALQTVTAPILAPAPVPPPTFAAAPPPPVPRPTFPPSPPRPVPPPTFPASARRPVPPPTFPRRP